MKYKKPKIIDIKKLLPPLTLNFAAPAVGSNSKENKVKGIKDDK